MKVYNIIERGEYLKEVATLEYEEWADKPNINKENRISKKIDKIKKQLKNKDIHKLILLENNTLIGFISIFKEDGYKELNLSPWYATMYIKKEYRNKGYSKILNDSILKYAYHLGYNKLYLKTTLNNYYEKFNATYIKDLDNNEKLYEIDTIK